MTKPLEPLFILNWTESYADDPINKIASEEREQAGEPPILLTFEALDEALLDYERRTNGYAKTSVDMVIPNELVTHELGIPSLFGSDENYSDFGKTIPVDENHSRFRLNRLLIGSNNEDAFHFRGLADFIKKHERPQVIELLSTFGKLETLKTYDVPVQLEGTISITARSEEAAEEYVDAIIETDLKKTENYLYTIRLKKSEGHTANASYSSHHLDLNRPTDVFNPLDHPEVLEKVLGLPKGSVNMYKESLKDSDEAFNYHNYLIWRNRQISKG